MYLIVLVHANNDNTKILSANPKYIKKTLTMLSIPSNISIVIHKSTRFVATDNLRVSDKSSVVFLNNTLHKNSDDGLSVHIQLSD